MFVILLTANFKFRNNSTCSKGPKKRAGKVCGDSRDLNSSEFTASKCSDCVHDIHFIVLNGFGRESSSVKEVLREILNLNFCCGLKKFLLRKFLPILHGFGTLISLDGVMCDKGNMQLFSRAITEACARVCCSLYDKSQRS